ncbi:MAG: hypothetical protein GWN14_08725 [candidate division Zixibacteria bacterium]|nr:hypothetical protein [candidate division Zixibacteria bacterium]
MINTIKLFNETIERKFWEVVIPLMKNEPELAKNIVNIGYIFLDRYTKRNMFIKSIFWICMGLSIGLGIGVLLP